jgi:hypothetical protein
VGPLKICHVPSRWHITFVYRATGDEDDSSAIPRKTALHFEPGPEWVMKRGVASRSLGAGRIELVADSYSLSNEGLRENRDGELISGLVGPAHRIVFDENHFGVAEEGSVTTLMRKYHLEGALAVLGLVAALFLWRSASSLLPPREARPEEAAAGRESIEGLTSLLRRGIAEQDLLSVCYAEWKKSAREETRARHVEQSIASFTGKEPVEAYRAASRILTEKNEHAVVLTEKK